MKKISDDQWLAVKFRVESMPSHLKLSIGGTLLEKNDLIKHINKRDEIGKLLVQIHYNYLRSFKEQADLLGK